MLIDRLQPEKAPLSNPAQPQSPSSSAQLTQPQEKQWSEEQVVSDQVLLTGKADVRLDHLQLQNERQNSTAAAIRDTDRAAQALGQKIDALKAPLQTIVKNFPPFSREDRERVELLMSYTALRKEIDQLTLPTPPSVVQARKELVLPAPLPMSADDSQIADHVEKLDAAGAALAGMRSEIAADTAALLQDGRFSRIFSAPKGEELAQFGSSLTESAAAQKSLEVGRHFANSASQGVAVEHPQFLKGLS